MIDPDSMVALEEMVGGVKVVVMEVEMVVGMVVGEMVEGMVGVMVVVMVRDLYKLHMLPDYFHKYILISQFCNLLL